jgi:hypothetical protein
VSTTIETAPPLELSFPQICLLVCLMTGRVKTVRHRKTLSLILGETESLRHILPANHWADFWIPRSPADRKRFNNWRRSKSRTRKRLSLPHWTGETRPKHAATRRLETNFPSAGYLTHLVSELGYDKHAAIAATVRAHTPWRRPPADRRRAGVPDFDPNDFYSDNHSGVLTKEFSYVYQVQPYGPESPSRRTTQGGFPKKRVLEVLRKRRWDDRHVGAVYEVMCQGHKGVEVAERLGLRIRTLYSYCNLVTKDLRDSQE